MPVPSINRSTPCRKPKKRLHPRPQASRQAAAPCLSPDLKDQALAVDAACSGNPGKMEYRGVHLTNFQQAFPFGPQYFGVNTSVILKKLFIFQRIL